jgi:WD40 repeat protein/serine/threonine protein kinase
MNTHGDLEEGVFREAVRLAAGPAREAYLATACAGDPSLRERIEELLGAHEPADNFLEPESGPLAGMPGLGRAKSRTIGRYELLETLGEGGFGVVYLARQREPVDRMVALKILKPGMDSRAVVARFEAERQALALMEHPSIARVLDGGTTDTGHPYFVMELVRGELITHYCDRGRLPIGRRLELVIEVCRAVQHAHQKGVIHRDLKPANVLVTEVDGRAVPKVIDFGIAKTLESAPGDDAGVTRPGQFLGTPSYMSPEQVRMAGRDIDTRTDVYSLGVLLYELLTGCLPFDAQALMAEGVDRVRNAILFQEPPRPSVRLGRLPVDALETASAQRGTEGPKLRNWIAGDLDWIVMRCLEKERGRRYETAHELALDLRRFLDREPVIARPPSELYRFQRLVQRQKLAFSAAAAVLASLLIGLGVSTWLWNRERSARWRAVEAQQETKAALARSDFLQAGRLAEAGQDADALAYLARSVQGNPNHRAAGIRLLTLLAYDAWANPTLVLRHGASVLDAQFSADGSHLLIGLADGTVGLWDLAHGRPLNSSAEPYSGVITTGFSPDGTAFATGSWDQTARVWDVKTGRPRTVSLKHEGAVYCTAFSPDGRYLVTGSADHQARVWALDTGRLVVGPLPHDGAVKDVQFSPDGSRIATASEDSAARIWDARSGTWISGALRHVSQVNAVRFSPDGLRLATASADHSAGLWDVRTGQALCAPLAHAHSVAAVRFSPDGSKIVTASLDATARIWDGTNGRPLAPALEHGGPVLMAEFSPDGQQVLTASEDQLTRIWDVRSGRRLMEPVKLHAPIRAAHISPDGHQWVTASGTEVRVHARRGPAALPLRVNDGAFTLQARFSPDGERFVTGSSDLTARIFDARTGAPVGQPMRHERQVNSAQFSPDARWILTASMDHTARLWDARDGRPVGVPLHHEGQVDAAEFSPDGRLFLTVCHDDAVRVWDTKTQTQRGFRLGQAGSLMTAHFSPDSQRIVTGSDEGTAQVWEVRTGTRVGALMRHPQAIHEAQFSPDGWQVITASSDGSIRLWEAASGQPLTSPMVHGTAVYSAEFNDVGQRAVTAGRDGRIRLWNLGNGQTLAEPYVQGASSHPRFSPAGHVIASAGSDGWLRLLDSESLQPVATALRQEGRTATTTFSPDSRRILSAANGVWLWDFPLGISRCPAWLVPLAEAISGEVLNEQGVLVPSRRDPAALMAGVRAQLAQAAPQDDWAVWGRWFLAPADQRPISPHSGLTTAHYIRDRIAGGTDSGREEVLRLASGRPEWQALIPTRQPGPSSAATGPSAPSPGAPASHVIFDGELRNGWEDYSWCEVTYAAMDPKHPGTNELTVKVGPWQGFYLHHAPFDSSHYDRISIWINGGGSPKQLLLIGTARQVPQPYIPLTLPANTWIQVVQSLATLHVQGNSAFDGFWLQDNTGTRQGDFHIRRIELLAPDTAAEPPSRPSVIPPR